MKPIIKIMGIGGSGSNTVSRLFKLKIIGAELIAANTDAQALKTSLAHKKILMGKTVTKGLGTGMDVELGRNSALEAKEEILEKLRGANMVFLTCGLGGGTGSGGIPVIADFCKDLGILTIGVVTTPFSFEGEERKKIAKNALSQLKEKLDSLIIISNDKLLKVVTEKTSVSRAFILCDEVLGEAVQSITDLVFSNGIISVDFASVISIMKNAGRAMFGVGIGNGPQRALQAAQQALNSPLLDFSVTGAQRILFNISGQKITLKEIQEASQFITKHAEPKAQIIFGAVENKNLKKDEMKISLIATKLSEV